MGCSPSKGHLFPEVAEGIHKALLPGPPKLGDIKPVEGENQDIDDMDIDKELEELSLSEGNPIAPLGKVADMAPNTAIVSNPGAVSETEVKMTSQVRDIQIEELPEKQVKKVAKRRKNKGVKQGRRKEKEVNTSIIQEKVDLPMHMARAHQAAYEYLNPNIFKCENLLELLDQAAQTQLSLQPMMTAIVMRFEEVNQALEEMAEEGELMLKEHSNHMAWPSETRAPAPIPAKPSADLSEPPPDLLQQLLQHSTEKLKLVGSSVQGLGDTALEEAADYFASLSKLLGEKLQAKRAVDERLSQVLARVEAAAKCNLDDLSLHSEDSGIGGENESLTGSERHRCQQGSSGSSGRARPTLPSHSPDQVCLNKGEDEEENEEDDDDEDEEDEEEERSWRVRSNSSLPDPIQTPKRSERQPPKRPQTTAPLGRPVRPPHSQSIESFHVQELQQKDLDQQMGDDTLRRHSSGGRKVSRFKLEGSAKANQAPSSLPAIAPQPPGRNSVKRLINTFSGGMDSRPGQSLTSAHLRGSRRSESPILPDLGSGEDIVNTNNNNNSWPVEGREDLDVDNLPPPPPEVLMDNSYESNEENPGDEDGEEEDVDRRGHPVPHQRSTASQRLRASLQSMTLLPNRGSVGPIRQDAVAGGDQQPASEVNQKTVQASSLYRQACKIIHLRNEAESPPTRPDQGVRGPLRVGVSLRQRSSNHYEGEYYPTSMPPTVPSVSRVRLPPSCPSTHHRLPSPPAFAQPNPPSRPSSPRVLRWSTENSGEEGMSPSVSFNDARLVFCQNSQSNSQIWTPSCSSTLPRPYGELSRGRVSTRGSQTVSRRSQSDQRPSLTTQREEFLIPGTPQARTRGSEPNITNNSERMVNGLVMEGENQSDPSDVAPTDLDTEQ